MRIPKMSLSKAWLVQCIGILVIILSLGSFGHAVNVQHPGYTIIKTAELQRMLDSKSDKFLIIDARNPEEYKDVHIPGAVNIPEKKFEKYVKLLPEDQTSTLIFYCNAGNRSYKAYRKLMKLGYKKFYQALFADWKSAGYEVVK